MRRRAARGFSTPATDRNVSRTAEGYDGVTLTVLKPEYMRAHADNLLDNIEVVLEVVLLLGVEHVTAGWS